MHIVRRGVALPFATILFFLLSVIASQAQRTIRVPADVPNIQSAIFSASNGDTIFVSPGTYFGTVSFGGKAVTLQSTDGAAVTILEGGSVWFTNGEGPGAVLRGFTVTHGSGFFEGGGIRIENASPTIEENIITANHACGGAGISAISSSAIIRRNTISNNISGSCIPPSGGAGIRIVGPGNLQLLNNTLTGNQAQDGGTGGGIMIDVEAAPLISGNVIQNNSAWGPGGGIAVGMSSAQVVNNLISGNSAGAGGGIYAQLNQAQPSFVNNTLVGNSAGQGSQIFVDGADATAEIANNLFIDLTGTGAIYCGSSAGQVPIFDHNDAFSQSPTGGQAPPYGGACSDLTGSNGNLQVDPQFVDPVNGNYHLQATSPVLDAGNNFAPNLPVTDLEGNARVAASNADTCIGNVDLGAYEIVAPSTGTGFLSPSGLNFGQAYMGAPPNGSQSVTLYGIQGCVQVTSIHISSDFQQTNDCGALLPGNACTIQVTFNPVAPGLRSGALQVNLGPGIAPLAATLTGQALNLPGSISPASLDFGVQPVGTTSFAMGVNIFAGITELHVTAVSVKGDFAAVGPCTPSFNSCFLLLTFTPTAAGLRTGVATITSNQGVFTVPLSGTGFGATASVSPTSLVFASQTVGTVSQGQTITLGNTGTADLLINAVIPPPGFQIQSVTCFGSLHAGQSCTYQVMSNPFFVGETSGTLEIDTNGGNVTVALTASGTPPIATLSPQLLSFAATPIGSASASQTVAVTNISGQPLQLSYISAPNNFLAQSSCPAVLDPNAGCSIDVNFVPNDFGPYSGFLTLATTLGNVTAVLSAGDGHNTFHVPADFPNIGSAIAAAQNGDTILVSPGTYVEQVNFQGKAITLASTGGPAVTILDGQNFQVPVIMFNNEPPQAVLRGFTITHGSGNGIVLAGASPTIEGNIITSNTGCSQGGIGIALFSSAALVRRNTVSNNADTCNFNGQGGGIAVIGNNGQVKAQILNNIITGNQSSSIGGAGIVVNFNGQALIQGNTIENNSTSGNGGGILVTGNSNADIVENVIAGNFGGSGGGIYEIIDFFGQSPLLLNNTIVNNTSATPGTAIYIDGLDGGVTLVNNLLVDSTGFGAVNCGPRNGQAPSFVLNDVISLAPGAPAYNGACPDATGVNGNIKQDPQFVDPVANNYHLRSSSPAIDVGIILPGSTPDFDLDGNGRIGPGNALSCLGAIDMGAYEFTLANSGSPLLPSQLDLGNAAVASSTTLTFTMAVSGCVQLASIKTTGDFQQSNFCGGAVSSSLGCSINITFAPTAAGPQTGSLKFDFGASSPSQTVKLTGTGFLAAMNTSPAILNFGSQNVQTTSAPQTVFIFPSFFGPSTPLMRLNGVWISGDFAQTNTCTFPNVLTGANCAFSVTFTPTASGPRQGSLVVSTNQGLATISLYGNGVSPLAATLTPSALSFGNQLVNTVSAAQPATLTNTGTTSFVPGTGAITGDFTVNSAQCGQGLAPGASCSYFISFAPSATGTRTGLFTVTLGGTPLSVSLSGTGVAPQATLSPQSVVFANQVLNTSSAVQTIALSNTGGAALNVAGISMTGDFAQSDNCTASLPPGASCNINVTFTPTALGIRPGTLNIMSNAGNFSIPLSGAGFNAAAAVTPSAVSFGSELLNSTTRGQTVVLTAGINPLQIASITASADFAQTNSCGASLAPGASCTIQVTFSPTVQGPQSGTLAVISNEGTLAIPLSGKGLARAPNTIYVPVDQPTIQAAISAAAAGQTVAVLPGTYAEHLNFQGKAITVTGIDGASATTIDGGLTGTVGTFASGEGSDSVLSGFTITRGTSSFEGGGIMISSASPTITGNTIIANQGCQGVGIAVAFASPTIQGNTISNNTSTTCSGGDGAGISLRGAGSAQILNNTITDNKIPNGGDGGGIASNGASPTIMGNVIQRNSVFNNGGGISFINASDATVVQNLITENHASGNGGGIYLSVPFGDRGPILTNNTIAQNTAASGSGVFSEGFVSNVQLTNNLILGAGGSAALECSGLFSSTPPILTANGAFSSGAAGYGDACASALNVNGNISTDPQFVDVPAGNYRVLPTSPVIDAGANSAPNLPALDLDRNPRIAFGSAATCSNKVDIGAYEFVLTTAPSATFAPASFDFGLQPVGTSSLAQNFTLTATQGCVTTQSVATTGDFSQTNNCSSALATGTSCLVQASFTPSLGGLRTGSLTITGNAGTLSSSLTGQGSVAIDATVSRHQGSTSTTITSGPFSTVIANELVLALISSDASQSNMTVSAVTGAGLNWNLVRRTNAQGGTAEIWRALAPSVLTNVTATATFSQPSPAASITIMTFAGVDTSGTNGSGAIGNTASASSAGAAPRASLTTTRANSWVLGVGNDYSRAIARTLGANQTLIDQYLTPTNDTLWSQRQNAPIPASGTSVTINDTAPTTDSFNLSIVEVRPPLVGQFSISGNLSANGAGAAVALAGPVSLTATADASGNYSLVGLPSGSYTVTPSKTGFVFNPASQAVSVTTANIANLNFTAAPVFSISGSITPLASGSGATLTLSGAGAATTTADSSGNFTFTGLVSGTYTITPSKTGFTFTPGAQTVTLNGANLTGISFTAAALGFSITGNVSANGAGATVGLSGAASASTTADSTGNYSFAGLANGTYTVTPTKAGFTFNPASQTATVNNANVAALNFTATPSGGAGLAMDVNVSKDGTSASTTIATPAFSTKSNNELLLAFIATDFASGTNTTVSSVTGGGLTWKLVQRTNVQSGTAEIWTAFASATLSNVTVTATVSQSVVSSITVLSFTGVDTTSGATLPNAIGATGTGNSAQGAPTASLVTTRNNSWVLGVGNDFDNPIARTLGTGQTLVHQFLTPTGDTYWVQMQSATTAFTGTTVTINDSAPSTDRYNLSIVEVRTP